MCKDLYEAASLKLVLDMRAGKDFKTATKELIDDRHWWSDWLDEYKEYPLKRKWSATDGATKQATAKNHQGKGNQYQAGKGATHDGQRAGVGWAAAASSRCVRGAGSACGTAGVRAPGQRLGGERGKRSRAWPAP